MYNGIGLQTARGSGTNGYVQRNMSFVKQMKDKIQYKSEDDFKRLERELNRVPNQEILEHQNKRQIELKCLQLTEDMESQGYSDGEIERVVDSRRREWTQDMHQKKNYSGKKEWIMDREGSPQNLKETHKLAEMNHKKNDNLKNALRISSNFIEGSSLDPTRKAKEAMAREALNQKKYALLPEPLKESDLKSDKKDHKSSDKSKSDRKDRSHKKQSRNKSSDSESESDSDSDSSDDSSSRKRSKTKSSKSKRSDKHKKSSKSKGHKSSTKRHKYSDSSSSGSDSESDSRSSSDSESSDSSNSSHYDRRDNRKNGGSKTDRNRRRSYSPEADRNRDKSRPHLEPKESTAGNDDISTKTSRLIEMNIKQMRKEAENSTTNVRPDSRHSDNRQHKEIRKESTHSSPPPRQPSRRRSQSRSRSRSSSRESDREPQPKRLKSAVYETKRAKEVPKSYSTHYENKRSESRSNRSLTPDHKRSRQSSRSRRSRSRSLSSNHSRSSASSKSSSSSKSSVSRHDSRSPSIPRRKGSPSFLEKRRITSARKRPIPYRRGSRSSSQSSSSSHSSRSPSRDSWRSLSVSSDSLNSYLLT